MAAISTSIEVNRPAAEVFAYATDPTRLHEWQKGVLDGHLDDPGTPRVGTRCLTTRQVGLARRPATAKVTHIETELDDTRSRLAIDVDFTGHGIGKILVPLLVRREARKEVPANVAALKRNLESYPNECDAVASHNPPTLVGSHDRISATRCRPEEEP